MRRVAAWVVLVVLGCTGGCTSVFFQPLVAHLHTPDELGLAYEDVYFNTSDGLKLHGWFLPAQVPARATILFLHGNAENISTHVASVYWLPAHGFNVFLPDYRGYGRSQGTPSLAGAQEDIDSAFRYVIGRRDVDPHRVVVFGQSLGGALAAHYVAHTPQRDRIRALVIESAFASYRGIAREKLAGFWLSWPLQWPLSFTVDDAYSPIRSIGDVSPIPLLIIHGEDDAIVPPAHAQKLYEAAKPPKDLWLIPQCGHIQAFQKPGVRERFVAYLNERLK